MTFFVQAYDTGKPKSETSKQIAMFLAAIMTVMAVAQLFTLEEFITLIEDFALPLGSTATALFAPLLITFEVFSIPFLLRMRLSVAMRWCSMVFGWLMAVLWFLASLWLVTQGENVPTVGFLGTLGEIQPGWWAVYVSSALGVLVAWASWGLWPGRKVRNHKK